jgi:hypothetical protein
MPGHERKHNPRAISIEVRLTPPRRFLSTIAQPSLATRTATFRLHPVLDIYVRHPSCRKSASA